MTSPTPAPEIVRVRPGPTATRWLIERIAALQGDDPLRPVTVVVPNHHAGLHLRRRLAARGYAGVRFSVLSQLAEALGAGRLAARGLAPLTAATRGALIRRALRGDGGPLAASAEQAGLVDLVAGLAEELRRRDDPAADRRRILDTGTATSRAAVSAISAYERHRSQARLHDAVDVLEAAAAVVDEGDGPTVLADAGAIVVHLPTRIDAPDARLLRSLAGRTTVVVALSRLEGADTAVPAAWVGAPSAQPDPVPPDGDPGGGGSPAVSGGAGSPGAEVVIAPDPVDEVRAAVRAVLAAMEAAGVPAHRTAIVHRDEETYGITLRDTLRAAGLTPAGLGGSPLAGSIAGRGLIGLIRLRDEDLSRAAVLAWLSGLPHDRGVLRDQGRWDQLSRAAGVVRGAAAWQGRLAAYAGGRAATLAIVDADPDHPDSEGRRAAIRRDIEDAHRIAEQVAAIDTATQPPEEPTWEAHVSWALRLRDEFLTPDNAWTAADREAAQLVEEVVRGLGPPAAVEPDVSVGVFRRALEDALRDRVLPEGRLGGGVIIGSHRHLAGMDLDHVHILGVLETAFPAGPPIDPLLPGDPLGRRAQREAQERHDWLAALATADGGRVTVSAPARDLDGRRVYPSPWLLELLAGDGPPPSATAVREGTTGRPNLRRAGGGEPAEPGWVPLSVADRREAEARAAHEAGRELGHTALAGRDDLPLGRTLAAARARRSGELTEFDGNVAAAAALAPVALGLAAQPQSASAIQVWATCPFRYLLGRVLAVAGTENDEDERWWQIDPRERGRLIHLILERFFREVAGGGAGEVARLEALAAEELDAAEARGAAGHPLVWAGERRAILADLRTLLVRDAERCEAGWRPAHLEQRFGMDGDGAWPVFRVTLPGGREATLRGSIDRIDLAPGAARIIDYKTARPGVVNATAENLFEGGRRLQLAVYAAAVRERARARGEPLPAIQAEYWYCTTRGGFTTRSVPVDDRTEPALAQVLAGVDGGIRAGCFPAVPGELNDHWGRCDNCHLCAYDSLCPAGREVVAQTKSAAGALAPYRMLQTGLDEAGS